MISLSIILILGAVAGLACIVLLVVLISKSAKRLDQRIDDYKAEPSPSDPYAELAKILGEDKASRPGSSKKQKGRDNRVE
ncbi:MAG: hypothetical protein WCL39_11595 [Armatimonadota bacterium]